MARTVRLSVVVPLFDEEDNVEPLVAAVQKALAEFPSWELVLVDDGSRDRTASVAGRIAAGSENVRLIRLARNYGQTAAMQAGFDHARGEVVVSMDGDLQNDPADIPRLLAKLEEGYDLVAGYRVRRQDQMLRRKVPSWVANRLIRSIAGVPIRDNGCSLKAYRRELLDRIHLYSDMHRFIPAIAAAMAGARITEMPVRHHPRRHGVSKYGLSRIWKVLVDLAIIKVIQSFRERPLLLFGAGAAVSMVLGVLFGVGSIISLATLRPTTVDAFVFPGASLLWFGLAAYLLMLGLIGEVALRHGRRRAQQLLPMAREVVS